jgi:hypothetical protein
MPASREESPAIRLEGFLARYTPEVAGTARAALGKMRALLPGAVELVYDNYNALAIGFGPGERTSDALFSLALYPRWVTLFFLKGAGLADPDGVLEGSGKVVRRITLESAEDLDRPEVRALIEQAKGQWDVAGPGRTVIRSISAKQRPRRPERAKRAG